MNYEVEIANREKRLKALPVELADATNKRNAAADLLERLEHTPSAQWKEKMPLPDAVRLWKVERNTLNRTIAELEAELKRLPPEIDRLYAEWFRSAYRVYLLGCRADAVKRRGLYDGDAPVLRKAIAKSREGHAEFQSRDSERGILQRTFPGKRVAGAPGVPGTLAVLLMLEHQYVDQIETFPADNEGYIQMIDEEIARNDREATGEVITEGVQGAVREFALKMGLA